ncbi:MAG: hypothetical protein IIB17_10000 [Chloroflexi bacterium]|nr:hypothetical protein [Chloroflexota bacterium]
MEVGFSIINILIPENLTPDPQDLAYPALPGIIQPIETQEVMPQWFW